MLFVGRLRRLEMAQTTFEVDDVTLDALAELKKTFGVRTNAQVIRKALALAKVAAQNAGRDNTLTIVSTDDDNNRTEQKILLQA
jgi:predicted negative regulator of RcsB-dependent stress response